MSAELEQRGGHNMEFIDRGSMVMNPIWITHEHIHQKWFRKYRGIDFETFSQFSELYKAGNIVSLSVGNGPERGHSGGSGIRAAMALQALSGNHGKLGAGVFAKPGNSFRNQLNDWKDQI